MAETIATLQAVITAETAGFTKGLEGAKKGMGGFGAAAGAAMGVATKVIDIAIEAAVGLGKATVGAAVEWDKAFKNIEAVTKRSTSTLQKQILNMKSAVAGPQELADAMYDIVGGVADASTHMAILDAANRTAEAGNANLKATTQGLISVMNSYKFSATQAAFASDVLTQTVNKGVGTMDQFVSAISPIAGLAASTGVKFDELGAAMAFMTTKGATAAQAGTQAQGAITALLKPNAQMNELLGKVKVSTDNATASTGKMVTTTKAGAADLAKYNDELAKTQARISDLSGKTKKSATDQYNLNKLTAKAAELQSKVADGSQVIKYAQGAGTAQKVTAEWLIKTYGLVGALTKLKEAAGGSSQKMAEALGSVEALRAFVALTGGDFAEFEKDFKSGLGGATEAARQIQLQSVSAQFETFKHTLESVALAIGSVVLPALNGIFTFFNKAAEVVGKFGPQISEVLGKVAGVFQPLLDEVNRVTGPLQAELFNIKTAFTTFFSKLFDEPAQVIQGDSIVNKINVTGKSIADKIGPAFAQLKYVVGEQIKKIFDIDQGTLDASWSKIQMIFDGVSSSIRQFIDKLSGLDLSGPKKIFDIIASAIGSLATTVGGAAMSAVLSISENLPRLGGGIKSFGDSLAGADYSGVKAIVDGLAQVIGKLVEIGGAIVSGAVAGIADALPPIGSAIKSFNDALSAAVKGDWGTALSGLGKGLGDLASGLAKIPEGIATKIGSIFNIDIQGGLAAWKTIPDQFVTIFTQIGTNIGNAIINLPAQFQQLVDGIKTAATNFVNNAISGIASFGHDFGFAIADNLKSIDIAAAATNLLNGASKIATDIINSAVSGIKGLADGLIAAITAELDKVIAGIQAKGAEIGAAIAGAITGTGAGAPIPKEPGSTVSPVPGLKGNGGPNVAAPYPGTNQTPGATKGIDNQLATGKQQRIASGGTTGAQGGGNKSGGEGDAYAYIEGFEAIMGQHGYRLGAAISAALSGVTIDTTALSAKFATMFSGVDITASLTNLGTLISASLATTFGADGVVMTALQPFADSWALMFGAGGTIAAAATGMQGVVDALVGSIVNISGTGTPAILEFQAVSTSAAPTIAGAWQPVVGVFESLLRVLEGIAGAATRATSAMGAVPGVGGVAGARAGGGAVARGQTYLVGEQGPELFTAKSNGQIIPNGGSASIGGSGGGVTITGPINVYGVQNVNQLYDQLQREAGRRNA